MSPICRFQSSTSAADSCRVEYETNAASLSPSNHHASTHLDIQERVAAKKLVGYPQSITTSLFEEIAISTRRTKSASGSSPFGNLAKPLDVTSQREKVVFPVPGIPEPKRSSK